jgi:hypothetical protein
MEVVAKDSSSKALILLCVLLDFFSKMCSSYKLWFIYLLMVSLVIKSVHATYMFYHWPTSLSLILFFKGFIHNITKTTITNILKYFQKLFSNYFFLIVLITLVVHLFFSERVLLCRSGGPQIQWSSCLSLLSVGIISVCHCTCPIITFHKQF